MIDLIINNPEYYLSVVKLINIIIFAFSLRFVLVFSGQLWCRTFAHTMSFLLLPIITFTVTSVISNNLALSLGLVGALSIVRFRNPVKSPFELTIYFLCISIGITSAVSWKWPILLSVISLLLIFISGLINSIVSDLYNKKIFKTSFSEGNSLNTLEIVTKERNNHLKESKMLISFYEQDDNCIYRFASEKKQVLIKLSENLPDHEVTSISFSVS